MSFALPDSPGARAETRTHFRRLALFALAIVVLGLLAGLLGALAFGCAPARAPEPSPRATARAAMLAVAYGAHVASASCVDLTRGTHDLALVEPCGHWYQQARAHVLVAETAVEQGGAQAAACPIADAALALAWMLHALELRGGIPPDAARDGLDLAAAFTRATPCRPGDAT